MALNLRQVNAFVAVLETGSFTKAAKKLHLSQPALTVQIRELEETLGETLLDRSSRGVFATRFGLDILPALRRTLADVESALLEAQELSSGRRGTVRIATLPSFAAAILPDLILASRGLNPEIRFIVHDAVAASVVEQVRNGLVDIGLTAGHVPDDEIDIVATGADKLCLVCPEDHAIARLRRIGVNHFSSLPLVLSPPGTSIRAVVDRAFDATGRKPVVVCEPTYMMTALALVRAGLGLTILPRLAREIRAEPSLIVKEISDKNFVRPIALIQRSGRTPPPAVREFMALCEVALQRL
jgi:DNA-binding transcriptional LysR family regulator